MLLAVVSKLLLLCSIALCSPVLFDGNDNHLANSVARRQPVASAGPLVLIGEGLSSGPLYTGNWGGAYVSGSNINEAVGTFVVPHQKLPPRGNKATQYEGAAWVGIGGVNDCPGLIQGGVAFLLQEETASFYAWAEWYPQDPYVFDMIPVAVGDTITVTIKAPTNTSGSVSVENMTSRLGAIYFYSDEEVGICQEGAEWIVETPTAAGVANFGNVTFTDASYVHNAKPSGVAHAQIIDLEVDGAVEVEGSVSGSGTVVCSYV